MDERIERLRGENPELRETTIQVARPTRRGEPTEISRRVDTLAPKDYDARIAEMATAEFAAETMAQNDREAAERLRGLLSSLEAGVATLQQVQLALAHLLRLQLPADPDDSGRDRTMPRAPLSHDGDDEVIGAR